MKPGYEQARRTSSNVSWRRFKNEEMRSGGIPQVEPSSIRWPFVYILSQAQVAKELDCSLGDFNSDDLLNIQVSQAAVVWVQSDDLPVKNRY